MNNHDIRRRLRGLKQRFPNMTPAERQLVASEVRDERRLMAMMPLAKAMGKAFAQYEHDCCMRAAEGV